MIEDTQSAQPQTAQPSPSAQSPQPSTEGNLQGTINQQDLENTGQTLEVQTTQQHSQAVTDPVSTGATTQGLEVGTGLLVAVFALAFIFVILLARFAMKQNNKQPIAEGSPVDDASHVATSQPAPVRRRKKRTRRQRRSKK